MDRWVGGCGCGWIGVCVGVGGCGCGCVGGCVGVCRLMCVHACIHVW